MVSYEAIDSTRLSWYQFKMWNVFSTNLRAKADVLRKPYKYLYSFFLLWTDTPARVPDMAEPYGDL